MNIKIVNPKEDMQQNQKENIFIVYDDKDQYLGSGYVFPKLSPEITPEHPLNIFIDMHLEDENLNNAIGEKLYKALEERALNLASVQAKTAYLYHGAAMDTSKRHLLLKFFEKKDFNVEERSHLMFKTIQTNYYDVSKRYNLISSHMLSPEMQSIIVEEHNRIFINLLDKTYLNQLQEQKDFINISLYDRTNLLGNAILYIENLNGVLVGRIEEFFITKSTRRKGVGTLLLKACYNYFNTKFIRGISLEVWTANKAAVNFYKKNGFETVKSTEYYLGKYI